ncbi:YfcE family phosphodiesterase [Nitratifractor salsuginis]|uniref:Phosphoesterase n=1 Tax=Nitratifractor salsuginis (strain DSM 16511 / JCM 12458 / E9I37-1) TaxID=749222 RepID=E6WZ24_NITSE|nr:YfcE family phosphodiesterase [Nitratifractor salsuginis]ADV45474.1 phosphodiesterase, MJ0936 family [Nitratifractor salsuginis DSM 16511]
MKIGVLSDPHRRSDLQQAAIDTLLERGAEYLLHAGDLCIEENLRQLEAAGVPYAAVFGNNDRALHSLSDRYRIKAEPWYFKLRDLKVKMMHLPYYLSPDTDLVIYGHTHRFAAEMKGKTLFLNPGEICAREKPLSECVLLEQEAERWIVHRLYRDPGEKEWQEESIEFNGELGMEN